MNSIGDNFRVVEERIASAAERAGRDPGDILLVVSTKNRSVEEIEEVLAAGARVIGENRVQEAREKHARLAGRAAIHMIGHLQRNKVREALRLFSMIHSVDSVRLAEEIEKEAVRAGVSVSVLLEVNVSGEASKFGFPPPDLPRAIERISLMTSVRIEGLMTMTPFVEDPEDVRKFFRRLREISGELSRMALPGVGMNHLSMGMTQDFEVAIEEGATMVRVGTAIFGER